MLSLTAIWQLWKPAVHLFSPRYQRVAIVTIWSIDKNLHTRNSKTTEALLFVGTQSDSQGGGREGERARERERERSRKEWMKGGRERQRGIGIEQVCPYLSGAVTL